MRETPAGNASQLRAAGAPPRRIAKFPAASTSNIVSLITPAVWLPRLPSAVPISSVIETYTAPSMLPRTV